MADIYKDIQAALETKLNSIVGIPDIAWENMEFDTTGVEPYLKPTFIPTIRRPAVRGLNPQIYYQGVFVITCYVPSAIGRSTIDDIVSKILSAFPSTSTVTHGPQIISIDTSERGLGRNQDEYYMVPVTISWYVYSPN